MEERVESGTVNISVRLNKELKEQAEILFSELGMNMSMAINVFLRQSVRDNGIPFGIVIHKPNAKTIAAMEEVEAMRRGEMPERIMSVEEVFGTK